MPKRKRGERSEAQIIADKHNSNCYCIEGIKANLLRILYDCDGVQSTVNTEEIEGEIDFIHGKIRNLIEEQYELEKSKMGKPIPQSAQ